MHCDTVYAMQEHCVKFDNNLTQVTQKQIEKYDRFEQVFAIWSHPKRSADQCWQHYKAVKKYYDEHILPLKNDSFIPHLSVEGGALLDNDITRLTALKSDNVVIMTLVWGSECCIGGAHNTNIGLSPFGKTVLNKMCKLRIIPDISHASDKMICETFEIASQYDFPVIASHSNSRKIRDHSRNITDDMFNCIKKSGGLTGINLYTDFLEDANIKAADISSIIRHIEHFLSLGGEDVLCLGCDFDGTDSLPKGISGVCDLDKLYEEMKKINYTDTLINKIFYDNAKHFFVRNNL